jgi:catechol 2,3-dioxygenase-like lactoylglutathione lyase family enzyme
VAVDLFGGIPVSDYARAVDWYQRLLGVAPAFYPNAIEAVWEVAEHSYLYIVEQRDDAGHAVHTIFVDDLEERVSQILDRGLAPAAQESYENGVRKVTYRDPDGNEVSFGGAAAT